MPRPKSDPAQKLRAYELYKVIGPRPTVIKEALDNEFGEYEAVSLRTISTWLSEFKSLVTDLDDSFEWHRLEEYGLPWEASSYLLQMWAHVMRQALALILAITNKFTLSERTVDIGLSEPIQIPTESLPTVREARWWWRVHLALPDLGNEDIQSISTAFAYEEMRHDVFGLSSDFDGLEAVVSLRPWEGDEAVTSYYQAVREGVVPLVRPSVGASWGNDNKKFLDSVNLTSRLRGWPSEDYPHLLPSQLAKLRAEQEDADERLNPATD